MIHLSGRNINIDGDGEGIQIIEVGLRPGEKLYEELLIGDKAHSTIHKQIFRAEEEYLSEEELENYIALIKEAEKSGNLIALRDILKKVVTGFIPDDEIVDVVYKEQNK